MSCITKMQKHLGLEIAAHTRYNGHAQIIRYRGYTKLADQYDEEAGEELGHANKIMHRLQQLEAMPQYQAMADVAPTLKEWDIEKLLSSDLEVEKEVLDSLADIIEDAESENDWETGNVIRGMVTETEHHVEWLTRQVTLIKELGKQNYLQAML